MNIAITILCLILYAEFVGYFLHKALHNEKIGWLSKNHMYHHLRDYGPKSKMRTKEYISGTKGRVSILGVGVEFLLPSILGILVLVGFLTIIGMGWKYQALSVLGIIMWSSFMFGYMHSRFHEKGFWMERVPVLRIWFKRNRRLHAIHHVDLSENGLMDSNYGICFFWMDRLCGTLKTKVGGLSQKGYEAAVERYKDILDS